MTDADEEKKVGKTAPEVKKAYVNVLIVFVEYFLLLV